LEDITGHASMGKKTPISALQFDESGYNKFAGFGSRRFFEEKNHSSEGVEMAHV
jgi:hypothetical protein